MSEEAQLRRAVRQVGSIRPVRPAGVSIGRLLMDGDLQEGDLSVTRDDLVLAHEYAALAVVSRDLHEYLAANPGEGSELFSEVVLSTSRADALHHGAMAFPAYTGLPIADLPVGIAARAAVGDIDLHVLLDGSYVHEWTFKAGIRLSERFLSAMRELIARVACGPGGLSERLLKGKIGEAEVIQTLATLIMTAFAPKAIWIPMAALLASIFVKRGLQAVCPA